ncbi:MAG: hypothetical protein ACPG63_06975 [Luminiphilus sp.]
MNRFSFILTVAVPPGISPTLLMVSLPRVITLWPAGYGLLRSLQADPRGHNLP